MKYLVLLMGDGELKPWDENSEAEQAELMGKFGAFGAACAERPGVKILAEEALTGSEGVSTIRTRGGEMTLTDGPYAEAVEGLGGFYLVEAPDLDVLTDLLRHLPAYDMQISPAVEQP